MWSYLLAYLSVLLFQLPTVLVIEEKNNTASLLIYIHILKERQGSFKETILKLKLRTAYNGDKCRLSAMSLVSLPRSKQKNIII